MNPLEFEIDRWREYALALRFTKPEDAEKDYIQELLLSELFNGKDWANLVFRGGTAISKVYGSGRFSEDLDFITIKEADASELETYVKKSIERLGLRYHIEYKKVRYRNMLKYSLKIKGPIYAVALNEQAKQTIGIDLNLYERPMLEVLEVDRVPIYDDARPYAANVLSKEELIADKAKAILERTEPVARDLYDMWFLAMKYGIRLDIKLTSRKMLAYGKRENRLFSMSMLNKKIRQIERIWDKEMGRLILNPPSYKKVVSELEGLLK
jgi:predicted nucleotidyltransferase component of viral defense system